MVREKVREKVIKNKIDLYTNQEHSNCTTSIHVPVPVVQYAIESKNLQLAKMHTQITGPIHVPTHHQDSFTCHTYLTRGRY